MILDSGLCCVFRARDTARSGDMPRSGYALLTQSWYGELSFETSPARPAQGRQELRTDARVRILQCRDIRQNDVVVLREDDGTDAPRDKERAYRVTRAYHGKDDDGPAPITDLSLEVYTP